MVEAHCQLMITPNLLNVPSPSADLSSDTIPQYPKRAILAIWAAATVPMGALAWIAAPALASRLQGPEPVIRSLLILLAGGLLWQFAMVVGLVAFEQHSLRWSVLREALWLRAPRNPRTGRPSRKVWLLAIPLILGLGAEELLPRLPHPATHDFGAFLGSHGGQQFMHGAWGWFAVALVMMILNTVLGEELLFRGFLLPRMSGAFGERDWLANGVLFAVYHVHVWWAIPGAFVDAFLIALPVRRYRSAWLGIAVHSAQTVVLGGMLLVLVLR